MKCVFDLFVAPKIYFSGKNVNKQKRKIKWKIKNKTHLQNPIFLV